MILGLAPMDGFTDCAYRIIVQEIFDKYGNLSSFEKEGVPAGRRILANDLYLRTEFMTADGYIANPIGVVAHIMTTKKQKNVIAQIHGGNKETLLATVIDINTKYSEYFKGIELNLGCPANNIMKSGGGSALLKCKEDTLEIIKTLSEHSTLPFSIKTRTGLNQEDIKDQTKFILEASKYCSMISIHGRTVKQAYAGEADRDFIYNIKKLVKNDCKIIGNGGIHSYDQAIKESKTLDGSMIGQAAIGNPRIFTSHQPTLQEKKETILRHLDLMIACEIYLKECKKFKMPTTKDLEDIIKTINNPTTNRAITEFRKHLFQYIKGIDNSREFKVKVSQITDYKLLVEEIINFFKIL